MCCTFNTSREALSYVGNHYAEILKQADQHHARIIDIVTPEELRNFLKILQEILAQNYPYEENDKKPNLAPLPFILPSAVQLLKSVNPLKTPSNLLGVIFY